MAVTAGVASQTNLHTTKHKDLDVGSAALQVGSGATEVFAVEIDNSANTVASYFKMWNTLFSSVSVGTTVPLTVLKIPAGVKRIHFFNGGAGTTFGTALAVACVTTGGTGGSTAPVQDVKATLWTD